MQALDPVEYEDAYVVLKDFVLPDVCEGTDHSSRSPSADSIHPVFLLEVNELEATETEERLERGRAFENELTPSYLTKIRLMFLKGVLLVAASLKVVADLVRWLSEAEMDQPHHHLVCDLPWRQTV